MTNDSSEIMIEKPKLDLSELKDRPFNPFRAPNSDDMREMVSDIINQMLDYEQTNGLRQRKRSARVQQDFEDRVTALICDLTHRYLTTHDLWLAIPFSHQILGQRSRYRPSFLGKTLPNDVKLMAIEPMCMVEIEKGYTTDFGGRQTRIRAGMGLTDLISYRAIQLEDIRRTKHGEVIILRDAKEEGEDKGKELEYNDKLKTNTYRRELNLINEWLADADISFDESVSPDQNIDDQDRHLRRIFNNSRFDQGGRLYGGFWQHLGKNQRHEGININGESVVTLDYSQMAPRILYGMAGAQPPHEDIYLLPGLQEFRKGVKKVFNALLFTEKRLTRMPSGCRPLLDRKIGITDLVRRISEAHEPIKDYFYTRVGFNLQFRESEILIDVLLELMKRDIVALPVHDAVVVGWSKQTVVREIMEDVFYNHTGIEGLVEVEGSTYPQPRLLTNP